MALTSNFSRLAGTALFLLLALAAPAQSAEPAAARLAGVSVVVGLDQGAVEVKSTTGPFGLYREHRKSESADFESFKNQIRDGVQKEKEAFEQYKAQIRREFVGYVESVTLKAGSEISLSGNTAVEREGVGENEARNFMRRWRAERRQDAGR